MDLRKMVKEVEVYSSVHKELFELIDEYINKYKLCESKYCIKRDLWIKSILREFEEVYKEVGFKVENEEKHYNTRYDKGTYFKQIAKYEGLEFEVLASGENNIYTDIRFLQTKPNSLAFNFELKPNIDRYVINFNIDNNEKYGKKKINIFRMEQVEKIKEDLKETKYTLDEMKQILLIIKCENENVERSLQEIEKSDFKGYIYKNREKIEFTSLSNLIELL